MVFYLTLKVKFIQTVLTIIKVLRINKLSKCHFTDVLYYPNINLVALSEVFLVKFFPGGV